jgi:hypothetical protein
MILDLRSDLPETPASRLTCLTMMPLLKGVYCPRSLYDECDVIAENGIWSHLVMICVHRCSCTIIVNL